MIPPNPSNKVMKKEPKKHLLKLQNGDSQFRGAYDEWLVVNGQNIDDSRVDNGNLYFECSYEDWLVARHVMWWYDEPNKVPVNAQGMNFLDFVGIRGYRLTSQSEKYNFCRYCYA